MKTARDIKTSTECGRNVQHKIEPRCMHDIKTSTGRMHSKKRALETRT